MRQDKLLVDGTLYRIDQKGKMVKISERSWGRRGAAGTTGQPGQPITVATQSGSRGQHDDDEYHSAETDE